MRLGYKIEPMIFQSVLSIVSILLTLAVLVSLNRTRKLLMSKIDELTAAVAAEKTVEDSAITLLNGLSEQLKAALASGNTDVAVQTVIDSINANKQSLADSVTANTQPPAA